MGDKTIPSYVSLKHPVTGEFCKYPCYFEQRHMDWAVQHQAKEGDIFICSHPKCGTTWLQTMVWLIVHNGQMFDGYIKEHMPMLEFDERHTGDQLDTTPYPCIKKTHFKQSWVPFHPNAKYIYITRNPKDACVSYYYHCKGYDYFDCENLDFDKLFSLYVRNEVEFFGYFNHVTDWYIKRNKPNNLFLLYEDIKRDQEGQVLKIAKFLGENYYHALLGDEKKGLRKVLEKSSFTHMQSLVVRKNRPKHLPFVRKGVVGDWKNHLSSKQSEVMEEMIRKYGGSSGWDKLWDNHDEVWGENNSKNII